MKTRLTPVLLGALLALTLAPLQTYAATKTWRGDFLNSAWSNPDNWNPRGAPQYGDDLRFDQSSIGGLVSPTVNDLTNLTVATLQFVSGSWQLSGNELGVTSRIGNGGDGEVEIHCAIRLAGQATFGAFSDLDSDSSELRLTGPVDLASWPLTLRSRRDATLDMAGPIVGRGRIIIDVVTYGYFSAGTVKFSGTEANTFEGDVFLTSESHYLFPVVVGSHLVLDKQSAIAVPRSIFLGTNCGVTLNRPHQIADDAAVHLGPGAGFGLRGNPETIGSLSLTGSWIGLNLGRSVVDTGDATLTVQRGIEAINFYSNDIPTIRGRLDLPRHRVINVLGRQFYGLEIAAEIIGDGGFIKVGTAGLLLSGSNTFTGDVVIEQGVLELRHANALGSVAGSTYLTGTGVLLLNNTTILGESLFARGERVFDPGTAGAWVEGVGANVWGGPVILETNLIVTGFNGGAVNLSGVISGPGGLRCRSGTVELSGPEANTFTGATVVQNPLLLLNKTAGVAAFAGPLVVGDGAGLVNEVRWLQDYQRVFADVTVLSHGYVNLNGHRDDFGPVTFHGGSIATGAAGELGLYGLLTVNTLNDVATIEGQLGLPPGVHEFRVHDGGGFPDLRVNAQIIGPGQLRKTGAGQMWLAAANSYEGLTTVAAGSLGVLDPNGLGSPTTGTTVEEGALLELNFAGTMPEPLALRGASYTGQGALGVFGDVTLRHPLPAIFPAIDLTASATIGVARNSRLVVDGIISGVGHLTKAGPGALDLAGSDPNTYSGETFINEGSLLMRKPIAVAAIPGPVSVGSEARLPAVLSQESNFQVIGNIFVHRNGLYNVNGQVENVDHLWLLEGGDVRTGTGLLSIKPGGSLRVLPGPTANQSRIEGNLEFDSGTHAIIVEPITRRVGGPELTIAAVITGPAEAITLQKSGQGWMVLSANNTYQGTTIVSEGVVQVDGTQPSSDVTVMGGATLMGNGRVGTIQLQGGTVAPGVGPGVLSCSGFNRGGGSGTLRLELNGTTPGTGYDQLNLPVVLGPVVPEPSTFGGVILQATLGYHSSVNDQFVIVNRSGTRPIAGEFNGLPEGATFYISSELFTITYTGGNGNDVVLTRVATPPRPALTIQKVPPASVRLLWPASFSGFNLQTTTNLSQPNWTAALPLPVTIGTNHVVTHVAAPAQQFYRLFKP